MIQCVVTVGLGRCCSSHLGFRGGWRFVWGALTLLAEIGLNAVVMVDL